MLNFAIGCGRCRVTCMDGALCIVGEGHGSLPTPAGRGRWPQNTLAAIWACGLGDLTWWSSFLTGKLATFPVFTPPLPLCFLQLHLSVAFGPWPGWFMVASELVLQQSSATLGLCWCCQSLWIIMKGQCKVPRKSHCMSIVGGSARVRER